MTNRERLNRMDNKAYADEINSFSVCEVRNYVDYEAWLDSSEEEYPIKGSDAVHHQRSGKDREVKLVGRFDRFGKPYCRIVGKLPGLHCFELLAVPAGEVEELAVAGVKAGDEA